MPMQCYIMDTNMMSVAYTFITDTMLFTERDTIIIIRFRQSQNKWNVTPSIFEGGGRYLFAAYFAPSKFLLYLSVYLVLYCLLASTSFGWFWWTGPLAYLCPPVSVVLDNDITPVWNLNFFPNSQDVPNNKPGVFLKPILTCFSMKY